MSCKSSPLILIPTSIVDSLALVVDEVPALLHESEGSSMESLAEASDDAEADAKRLACERALRRHVAPHGGRPSKPQRLLEADAHGQAAWKLE